MAKYRANDASHSLAATTSLELKVPASDVPIAKIRPDLEVESSDIRRPKIAHITLFKLHPSVSVCAAQVETEIPWPQQKTVNVVPASALMRNKHKGSWTKILEGPGHLFRPGNCSRTKDDGFVFLNFFRIVLAIFPVGLCLALNQCIVEDLQTQYSSNNE
eukprot:scaffold22595_cov102-Cylindrotheca_fusiformis.AAC.3